MKIQPVSLEAVAREAGVHKTTVSRVFRNNPSIPETTRNHVLEVAARLGYKPNPLVSALMQRVRSTRHARNLPATALAYLAQTNPRRGNPTERAAYEGLRDRAASLGYSVDLFHLGSRPDIRRCLGRILQTRAIQGVVLGFFVEPHFDFDIDWSRFSVAAIGRGLDKPPVHRALNDQVQHLALAVAQCAARGYGRIALAIETGDEERVAYRYTAGIAIQAAARPELAFLRLPDQAYQVPQVFNSWIRKHKPEVLITATSEHSGWLEEAGLGPEEIGLLHLNAEVAAPRISGILQDFRRLGETAVDIVDSQLRWNQRGIPPYRKDVTVPGTWREGSTLRPLPAGAAISLLPTNA